MHGDLWPNAPMNFGVSDLDPPHYKLWVELVDKYFEAGFYDPGLWAVSHEERKALARKYPRQFGEWLRADVDEENM